jgi:hypothetical protein
MGDDQSLLRPTAFFACSNGTIQSKRERGTGLGKLGKGTAGKLGIHQNPFMEFKSEKKALSYLKIRGLNPSQSWVAMG